MKQGPGTVDVNGLRLWYTVQGAGPVCLVPSPGLGFSVDLYMRTLVELSDVFTLVFIDSRGSGRSQKPADATQYHYSDFAADLDAVRRTLGCDRAWVFGHSLSGVVAMHYALEYGDALAGLVLVGTYAETDEQYYAEMNRRIQQKADEPWFRDVDWGALASDDEFQESFLATLGLYVHDAAKVAEYRRHFEGVTFAVDSLKGWYASEGCAVHLLERLPDITCPTFLVTGDGDHLGAPAEAIRIQDRLRGATLMVIPEAAHFPWFERPDLFFPAVKRFVAGP